MTESIDAKAPTPADPLPWADLPAYRAAYRQRHPIPPLEAVVPALAERKQWLMWQYEEPEKPTSKPRKMPYYARGARRAGGQGGNKDRAALASYQEAAAAALRAGMDGVGFAFLPDDGLIGIDLDGMIDPESGEISERCSEIIKACDSYTEYSPSGKGVHIICLAPPDAHTTKSNKVGVEVFVGRQYFTFTAATWPGAPRELRPLSAHTLKRLEATVRQAKGVPAPAPTGDGPAPAAPTAPAAGGGRQRSLAESVALAEEALACLGPDDYEQWIEIGLACKAGLGTAGYYVWDAWSARSPKYAGGQDTRKRWDGFAPKKVTLGTIFGLAEAAGWVSPWAKAKARKARSPRQSKETAAPPPGSAASVAEPAGGAPAPLEAPAGGGEGPPDDDEWQQKLLRKKGEISACLANAELLLSHMREWQGVIAYDEFAEKTVYRAPLPFERNGAPAGEWTDHLDVMSAIWLQRAWSVEFSPTTTGQAVEALARSNRFHPVREALRALPPWDGTRRNAYWLADFLGVEQTAYTALAGAFFLRGMIKRVMEPGCKFDYALVLEGDQGKGKSTAARILAWNWFADTDLDLNNKDALMALPGHWVYEIAELGSLMKAEERKQKSFLSRQEDEYRPPYGKRLIKVPRQSVFIGTTNEEEYLKDATGARRFWPVKCGDELNLDGLRAARDQMFAEALADYAAKERCFPTPEEQKELFDPEQAKRGMPEPFEEVLWHWVKNQVSPFSMADAAVDGLKMTPDKLTPAVVTRLGIALRKLGCGRKEDRLAAPDRRRLYLPPEVAKTDMRGTAGAAAAGEGMVGRAGF